MKWIYPDYYPQFKCIADRCRHNCCIGWEIDIDYSTMGKYQKMKGPMGDRVRRNIEGSALDGHFILDENERCPLLNENGLCDLILEKGEKALCQICRDHPRFRCRLKDREEIGLGLCCEEACRLILDQKEPMRLLLEDNGRSKAELSNGEKEYLSRRNRLLAIATDRSQSVYNRMDRILEEEEEELPDLPFKQWVDILLQLERLDENWTTLLKRRRNGPFRASIDDITQENLLVYFLYRHYLKNSREGAYFCGAAAFSVLSTQIIALLCEKQSDVYDVARMYSAEIEYSDENLDALMGMLNEYNGGTME